MNIYFSCSITGGRAEQPIYQTMVEYLLAQGHVVPTAHLSGDDVAVIETDTPEFVYQRDTGWVIGCDAIIAEVSTPSHGVGYEIALGVTLGKPVLCCYQEGKRVSKMLLGNPNVTMAPYTSPEQALIAIENFLKCYNFEE